MNFILLKKYQKNIYPIFDLGLNGINYFTHIICSWFLSESSYGNLNALLSFLSILFVSGVSLQFLTAKEVAKNEILNFTIIKLAIKYLIFIIFIYFLFSMKLKLFLHSNYFSLIILIFIFIFNTFLCIFRGIFQGNEEFLYLNISFYIEILSKFILLIIFFQFFKSEMAVLFAILLGMIFSFLQGFFYGFKRINKNFSRYNYLKEFSYIFISNFFIYYFTSVDMILVNYKLNIESGIYAVVLRYSQLILFISFSVITTFVPTLSKYSNSIEVLKSKIKKYLLILLSVHSILLILYIFILPFTIKYLFGMKYIQAEKYLYLGAIAYVFLANCFYLVNVNIILKRKLYLYLLSFFSIIYIIIFYLFINNILQVFLLSIITYLFLFISLTITLIYEGESL